MEVTALMAFLSPCLPFLIKLGEKAAETVGSQLGKDVSEEVKGKWEAAQKIWSKLYPKMGENEKVRKAVEDFRSDPDDEDYKNSLQNKFNTFLNDFVKKYPDEAKAIAKILQDNHDSVPYNHTEITQNAPNNKGNIFGQVTGNVNL